jgi:hypothetical protein
MEFQIACVLLDQGDASTMPTASRKKRISQASHSSFKQGLVPGLYWKLLSRERIIHGMSLMVEQVRHWLVSELSHQHFHIGWECCGKQIWINGYLVIQ